MYDCLAYTVVMKTAHPVRDQRIALRLTAWQKQTIERAAALQGGSVTDFAIQAMIDRAQEMLADQPVFDVPREAWEEFNHVLDAPGPPLPGMVDLITSPTVFDE